MADEDEILDVVDLNDNVVGTIERSKIGSPGFKGYVRAAELLIINDEGKIWVPRRQMSKRIAPGGLDYSAAGHVASGEDYESTLKREVSEELNLSLEPSKLEFMHKFAPTPDLPPYFRAVYLYRTDKVPAYNTEDFSGYEWMEPKEFLAKLKAGEPAKRSLVETLEYLINKQS